MRFTHLIEINDPLNPLIEPLSVAQVWRGLVWRVRDPMAFIDYLERAEIAGQADGSLLRRLDYGNVLVQDHVHLYEEARIITTKVAPQGEIAAALLTVTIEAPMPERLFVRFAYDDGQPDLNQADAFYHEHVKSAYVEADISAIRRIREAAQQST